MATLRRREIFYKSMDIWHACLLEKSRFCRRIQGEGEWKAKVHGKGRPRKWIKLHIAIDERTQEIVGEISTEAIIDDGKAFPKVMQQVKGRPKTVIGDRAYDDRDIRAQERIVLENRLKCVLLNKIMRAAG